MVSVTTIDKRAASSGRVLRVVARGEMGSPRRLERLSLQGGLRIAILNTFGGRGFGRGGNLLIGPA